MLICHDLIILWHIITKYFSSRNIFVLLFYDSSLGGKKKNSCSLSTPTTWTTRFSLSGCLWHFTSLNGRNSLVWERWWWCIYSWLMWIGRLWICLLPYYPVRSSSIPYSQPPTNTHSPQMLWIQQGEVANASKERRGVGFPLWWMWKLLARRRAWALQAHNCIPRSTRGRGKQPCKSPEFWVARRGLFWSPWWQSQDQSGYRCHSLQSRSD